MSQEVKYISPTGKLISFSDLQRDALIEILKNLKPRDVLKLCQTEKYTRDICGRNATWTTLLKTHYPKAIVKINNPKKQYVDLTIGLISLVLKYPERNWSWASLS